MTHMHVKRADLGRHVTVELPDRFHVELHDYVDARVPVLDRMHTKRLPAYATLGFDIPKTRRQPRPSQPRFNASTDLF